MSLNHSTITLNLGILGDKEAEVAFYYSPGERQTWEDPGCEEEFEIEKVLVGGIDICPLLDDDDYDTIIDLLIEAKEDYFDEPDYDEPDVDDYYQGY